MLSWILTNIRHAFLRPTEAIFNRCVLQLISKQLLSFCSHTFPQRFGHNVRYLPLQRHYSDGDISSIITGCCAKTRFYRSLAPWTRFARQVSRDSCFMKISIAAESKERGMEFHQLATKPERPKKLQNHKEEKTRDSFMFEGKNIHSSPVDGKLLCSYSEKVCMQRRLNGFAFCIRHILEDKGAPFKQCQFFAKYNKSRCINPVPILEKRDYCNSHMQVLGIIPKKLKKRKETCEKIHSNNHEDNNSKIPKQTLAIATKHHVERKPCTQEKAPSSSKNKSNSASKNRTVNNKINNKRKHKVKSTNKPERPERQNPMDCMMPPLRWNPHGYLWKKLFKKRRLKTNGHFGNISYPAVERLAKVYEKIDGEDRDLFKIYTFDRVENELSDCEDLPLQSSTTAETILEFEDFPGHEIKSRLKHQQAQLRQSIKSRLEDKKITYSVLQTLVKAAKTNALYTANVLNPETEHKPFRSKRKRNGEARCAENVMPDVRCSKPALPYSRHCVKHISQDEDQVLFGKCTARFAAGSHCGVPVVDLINERPLCNEHALKKINSANKEAALPLKRLKKPEKVEKNRTKPPQSRRNLKAQLQKKFAIPNKPRKKSNCHVGYSTADEDRPPPEKKNSLKLTFKASNDNKWVLGDSRNDLEKAESMVVTPRSYDQPKDNDSPSANDIHFEINTDSLSSPSLLSEDEDHYPLINMGRSHHDSYTFEDDDDLLRSSTFTMSRIDDPRNITSPTLTQLSADSIPSSLSLGELCSPAKLALDKPLFESPPPIKQENATPGYKRSLSQAFDIPVTANRGESLGSNRLIGSMRSERLYSSANSLMNSERYSINETNIVNSTSNHSISSNMNCVSSTVSTWATKFTLPTRNEQLPSSGAGFIRVGPTQSSIYSPPFTSPSSRSKAEIFKFENNTKQLENDMVVLPREPPSYSAAVRSLDRKFDVEPPLQKVNPDIFLSTMYTVPESSNS